MTKPTWRCGHERTPANTRGKERPQCRTCWAKAERRYEMRHRKTALWEPEAELVAIADIPKRPSQWAPRGTWTALMRRVALLDSQHRLFVRASENTSPLSLYTALYGAAARERVKISLDVRMDGVYVGKVGR